MPLFALLRFVSLISSGSKKSRFYDTFILLIIRQPEDLSNFDVIDIMDVYTYLPKRGRRY